MEKDMQMLIHLFMNHFLLISMMGVIILEVFHKGATINCLIIDHSDTNKELYNFDDKTLAYLDANLIRWIEDNNIIVPKIMLTSNHIIFEDLLTSQNFYGIAHGINPKYFNGPKNKYTTEDTSEYHPNNINKHPLHLKFKENFLSTFHHYIKSNY